MCKQDEGDAGPQTLPHSMEEVEELSLDNGGVDPHAHEWHGRVWRSHD